MTTITSARDAINTIIRTAWLASGTTSAIALLFDDVVGDKPGDDVTNPSKNLPYARVTVRHTGRTQETLGGVGARKHQTSGVVTVQVFTPYGDGLTLSDAIVEVVKASMDNVRDVSTQLWFFDVTPLERGRDRAWFNVDVVGGFRYEDKS